MFNVLVTSARIIHVTHLQKDKESVPYIFVSCEASLISLVNVKICQLLQKPSALKSGVHEKHLKNFFFFNKKQTSSEQLRETI